MADDEVRQTIDATRVGGKNPKRLQVLAVIDFALAGRSRKNPGANQYATGHGLAHFSDPRVDRAAPAVHNIIPTYLKCGPTVLGGPPIRSHQRNLSIMDCHERSHRPKRSTDRNVFVTERQPIETQRKK